MRSLEFKEVRAVAGGDGKDNAGGSGNGGSAARKAAIVQCEGLSDDTRVTFTIGISASAGGNVVGIGGEAKTSQTVTIETTCGDLRNAGKGG